jgi:biopolymer transport protein ExbD
MRRILTLLVLMALIVIAFFMYTTKTAKPQALNLFTPKDEGKDTGMHTVKPEEAFTVLLGGSDHIYHYVGEFNADQVKKTDYKEIRAILAKKNNELGNKLVVIIKPGEKATYTNTVNILDEMTIGDIKRYALVDITPQEKDYLKTKE